jgi:hypothetical protein
MVSGMPQGLLESSNLSMDYFILQPVSSQDTSTDFAVDMPAGASKAWLKYFVFFTISVYHNGNWVW